VKILTTTDEISGVIQSIIQDVTDELFLISPYIQLEKKSKNEQWEKVKQSLRFALKKDNVTITFMAREPDRKNSIDVMEILEEFLGNNCKVILVKDLHSKVYYNGKEALITSLNLYMHSAFNNYEIGVSFDQSDTKEIEKIENYIQFLISEGNLFQSEEVISNILEEKGKSEQKREDFESVEFKVVAKGTKWYKVETIEGYGNDIAIDSVQELLVGEKYKAKATKEFIRHKYGFRVIYRDAHDISQL